MRVNHPEPVKTGCPTYACTLAVEDHEQADEQGQTWHFDDSTMVHWPLPTIHPIGGQS